MSRSGGWPGTGEGSGMQLPAGAIAERQEPALQPGGCGHCSPADEAAGRLEPGGPADGVCRPLQHGPGLCSRQGRASASWLRGEAGQSCQQHGHRAAPQCRLGPAESGLPWQHHRQGQHHVRSALDRAHVLAAR